MKLTVAFGVVAISAGLMSGSAHAETTPDGAKVLLERCQSCHERLPEGGLNRISRQRKTPDGWDMVISRMRMWHGVEISDSEQQALVSHLSETQGLAPEEAQPFRYILEKRPSVVEVEDADLSVTCARCHSLARVGLQRRDADEWAKLAHMHLGQFPTVEYSALGRDRDWFDIAVNETSKTLGARYGFESAAWTNWLKQPKKSPEGTWRVAGNQPGVGSFEGTAKIAKSGSGYAIRYALTYADGHKVDAAGKATVYTGYEWRGSTDMAGNDVREVFALAADGNSFSGRFFNAAVDSVGGDIIAVRADQAQPHVLSIVPPYLKAGTTATVSVHGTGLDAGVDFGAGVTVKRIVKASPDSVVLEVEAKADVAPGTRTVAVAGVEVADKFTVYRTIDALKVEPEYAIARVGANGGPTPIIPAQFEAVGYLNGPDGKLGTADDIRIGAFPAAWTTENFNEDAEKMQDTAFAGDMDRGKGFFMPRGAGPNPERKFQTNNAGDLAVIAEVHDGSQVVEGSGRLVVSVQRWVEPPVR